MTSAVSEARGVVERPALSRGSVMFRVLNSAWFAFGSLVLLQLRVIWGLWAVKDVPFGDTSYYFIEAVRWFNSFEVDIFKSPLYTAFFGSFLFLNPDPVQAVLLHRLAIIFAGSVLVLALLRRLLPPGFAWLAAAWWVVLPINFDTLVEVHLFALLPPLAACLLLSWPSRWARGAALAVLAGAALLLRYELSVAAGLLGLALLVYEWRTLKRSTRPLGQQVVGLLAGYGIPLSLAAMLCLFAYSRSIFQCSQMTDRLRKRHTHNMAQAFAFGYWDRHREWTHNPWTEYPGLMLEQFGKEEPSFVEMLCNNPRAMRQHFAWNWRLAPSGLELVLFNAIAGKRNPHVVPVPRHPRWALSLSALLLCCWAVGLVLLTRSWRFWWRAWLKRRALAWTGMLAVAAVTPLVITTQRPRPYYLFGLSVFLMAGTGMGVFMLTHRIRLTRRVPVWIPNLAVALVTLVTPYYFSSDSPPSRPLRTLIRRMEAFADVLQSRDTVILQGVYAGEICNYVGHGRCRSLGSEMLFHDWPAGVPLEQFLTNSGVNTIYLDNCMVTWLEGARPQDTQAFLGEKPPSGWRRLGGSDTPGDRWRMYQRVLQVSRAE